MDKHSAAERLAAAEREVELSRQRLAETRRDVVEPLRQAARENQFSYLIRRSLR